MVNPLTNFFKGIQETEEDRIGRMSERVAEHSVDSQKQADEYMRPQYLGHMYYLTSEYTPKTFNAFTCVNSHFAGRKGGVGSSFATCRHYTDEARTKRDALVAKVAAEATA